jgi:hypothetical protein
MFVVLFWGNVNPAWRSEKYQKLGSGRRQR